MISLSLYHFLLFISLLIFQNIPRLAVQRPAESLQRRKPHSLGLVIFQDGQICRRDADLLGQLARAFVAARSTPENRPKIKAILTKYGVKKLTELQESQYEAVKNEVAAL